MELKEATCRIAPELERFAVPVETLSLDPANARQHNARNLESIRRSYERFGQQKPIVVDADGKVIAGNGQLEAAKALGWTQIAAIRTDLQGAEATAFGLADNRTSDLAEWDEQALAALIADLQAEDAALLVATGFSEADINSILEPPTPPADLDRVPAPPDQATTQRGDLWILGEHRLLCGDSASAEDLDRLLDGAMVQLVNTDPPYNVRVEPRSNTAIAAAGKKATHHQKFDQARHKTTAGKGGDKLRPKDRPLENDFVTDEQFAGLLRAWFGQIARVLEPGRAFYIWGGYANLANYPLALREAELYFSQAIIWVKEHPVLTRKDFMGNHEWCFYGWRKGGPHWFAPGIHNVPDVWEISRADGGKAEALGEGLVVVADGREFVVTGKVPKKRLRRVEISEGEAAFFYLDAVSDVWRVKKVNPASMVHLTEKPVELAVRAMHYSSRRGENVLDLFGGSGSTLMAAEFAGRQAYLMELDQLYCDVIVQRWEEYTGRKAERHGA